MSPYGVQKKAFCQIYIREFDDIQVEYNKIERESTKTELSVMLPCHQMVYGREINYIKPGGRAVNKLSFIM